MSVLRPPSLAIDPERAARLLPRDPGAPAHEHLELAARGRAELYPFGALAEAHAFVKDAESLALWKARRDELFDEIDRLDVKTRGQSGIRVIGPTP
jgi:hypothetical protein